MPGRSKVQIYVDGVINALEDEERDELDDREYAEALEQIADLVDRRLEQARAELGAPPRGYE
jgi:hypothetical protein